MSIAQAFDGNDRVFCARAPEGMLATATRFGPYDRLDGAHSAIRKWRSDRGYPLAWPNWEIYGHWTDDPAQLGTDVFYLLQAGSASEPNR